MPMSSHTLSFRLRIARTRSDLLAACQVRAESYGRHLPHLRAAFTVPDNLDLDEGTSVFLCVDKSTNEPIGTARVQTNSTGPLLIEHSIELPTAMHGEPRAEITRLAVAPGADPLVKLALWKASYLYCAAAQVRWMVVGARSEALVRQYRRLGFGNLYDDGRLVPLRHAGGLPHHVVSFNVTTAEREWHDAQHPMYDFIFETAHRDIDLFSTRSAIEERPLHRPEAATVE